MVDVMALAPEAAASWAQVRASVPADDPRLGDPAVHEWAEQFRADIGGITAEQRAAFLAVVGERAFDVVTAVWATDMGLRVDAALTELGGGSAPIWPAAEPTALWPAIDGFLPVVARLVALDPVTTELVRLRGARANACRLCCSRRSVDAVESGATLATFDAVDRYESSDLSEAQKVALRLTDAMLWTPQHWPAELAEQVHAAFSSEQAVELVLDVARNGANRIAVALGADAASVTEGVEWFATDAAGDLSYGLPDPVR